MKGIIFGATLESAHTQMEKIIIEYKRYWNIDPEQIRKSRNEFVVIFSNGDRWQAVNWSENQRGRRANVLLIDRRLSLYDVSLIECCLINRPFGCVNYYWVENN